MLPTKNTKTLEKEELWRLCFDDSPNTPRELFSISDIETLSLYKEDTLTAMATLVPVKTNTGLTGYYLYGVCTNPKYRGMGFFKSLMERCERYAKEKSTDFLCLIAADKALAETYRRMGYSFSVSLAGDELIEGAIEIRSLSESFSEFAESDENSNTQSLYGLLKPLFSADENLKFFFSEHMGEI